MAETTDVLAQAKVAVEATENAFLSKLFPEAKPQETAKAEVPAEAQEEAPAETTTESAPKAETDEKETKEEPKAESDPDWEKACTALKLDGVPDAVLEGLDRAEAIKWASKAKERHAKTAKELQEKAAKIKELESGRVTTKEADGKQAATADDDDPLAKIREAYGEELAAPLAKWMEKQREAYDARLRDVEADRVRTLIDGARASLKEQFPQLDDPEKLEAVQSEMAAHVHKYQDLSPHERAQMAMRDAARVLFFDEVKASEAGKALASYRKKMTSQPTPPNGKTPTQKAMTSAEREEALLEAIFRGDTEAKGRLMRLSV